MRCTLVESRVHIILLSLLVCLKSRAKKARIPLYPSHHKTMLRSTASWSAGVCLRRSQLSATRVGLQRFCPAPMAAIRYRSSAGADSSVEGSGAGRRSKASISQAVAAPAAEAAGASATPAADATAKKSMMGKFTKLAREKGLGYALYLYVFGEAISILITYLLHFDILGAGDVLAWLNWMGLGSLVDLDNAGSKHTTIFGYEVSVRLLTNYGIANVFGIPLFPLEVAFCAVTYPYALNAVRRLKFWKSRPSKIPKAPQATGAAAASPEQLPK